MIHFYPVRKSIKFKVKCTILEKSKTDSIDTNYLSMLSKNAQLNKKNPTKQIKVMVCLSKR